MTRARTVFIDDRHRDARSRLSNRRAVVTVYGDGSGHIAIYAGQKVRGIVSLNREGFRRHRPGHSPEGKRMMSPENTEILKTGAKRIADAMVRAMERRGFFLVLLPDDREAIELALALAYQAGFEDANQLMEEALHG